MKHFPGTVYIFAKHSLIMEPHWPVPLISWYVGETMVAQGKLPKEDPHFRVFSKLRERRLSRRSELCRTFRLFRDLSSNLGNSTDTFSKVPRILQADPNSLSAILTAHIVDVRLNKV